MHGEFVTCPGTNVQARSEEECPKEDCPPEGHGAEVVIHCTDGSTATCAAGTRGCYDKSPTYCPPAQKHQLGATTSIKCADGSTATCAAGTRGCYDESPTYCPPAQKQQLGTTTSIKCADGSTATCAAGTRGCYDESPTYCPPAQKQQLGATTSIKCADGSTATCAAGTRGCYDESPTYCPPAPKPQLGATTSIKCADGSTATCAAGTRGCYDESPTYCGTEVGAFNHIRCDGQTDRVKCLAGTAGCYDNSPILCPAPAPSKHPRDACLSSSGYTWCAPKQKCVRLWEEPCCDVNAIDFGDEAMRQLKIERCVADVFDASFFDTCVSYLASGSSTAGAELADCGGRDFEKTCRALQQKMTVGMAKDYCTNMTQANDKWWSEHLA